MRLKKIQFRLPWLRGDPLKFKLLPCEQYFNQNMIFNHNLPSYRCASDILFALHCAVSILDKNILNIWYCLLKNSTNGIDFAI